MAEKGFDPNKSKISEESLMIFLKNDIQEDILSVPGVGPAAAEKLKEDVNGDSGIETTYQLIGKFLTLKGKGMSSKQGIVNAIAQKVDIMIPGIAQLDAAE